MTNFELGYASFMKLAFDPVGTDERKRNAAIGAATGAAFSPGVPILSALGGGLMGESGSAAAGAIGGQLGGHALGGLGGAGLGAAAAALLTRNPRLMEEAIVGGAAGGFYGGGIAGAGYGAHKMTE